MTWQLLTTHIVRHEDGWAWRLAPAESGVYIEVCSDTNPKKGHPIWEPIGTKAGPEEFWGEGLRMLAHAMLKHAEETE